MHLSSHSFWKHLPDRSYERPLGAVESGFYWDSVFARTADTLRCSQIKVIAGDLDEIIGLPNVLRAWTNVKKRFPLLGSRLYERDNDVFVNVSEERLLTPRSNEISVRQVVSWEEALHLADGMVNTEGQLSNDLLAHIVLARHQGRTDTFYFLFTISHIITDGMSNDTIIKTFLNELSDISSVDHAGFEERLALSVASEELNPAARFNTARQRWRKAIAAILASNRLMQLKGGHGLPRKISERTQFTPSRSSHHTAALPTEISTRIIQNCRKQGITFGNAYPIIAQLATARLLLRRYLQGEIDEAEWEFRKKEPMYSAGPINLRTFLDQKWLDAGGMDHACLAIGFYFFSVSFLPLGSAAKLQPGMALPAVGDLLTRGRFFYRAKLVQKQGRAFMGNPLFLEIGNSAFSQRRRVERAKATALEWRERNGPPTALNDRLLTPMEQAFGLVFCNGGSSMGNMDKRFPQEYPLTKTNESFANARLQLGQVVSRLRCRPGELYLGAVTMQKQLRAFIQFDSNVFDKDLTNEWLEEIRLALEFYLGYEDI